MITVKFSIIKFTEKEEPIVTYTGNKLDFRYDNIYLDNNLIATRQRCYDFDYFILEDEKLVDEYNQSYWLSRMTVEMV